MAQFIRKVIFGIGENRLVSRSIEGLHVNFKVEQSSGADANTAEITIYNLSNTSISALTKERVEVFLNVGYEKADSLLFWGNDIDVETQKQGVNRMTIIKAKDAGRQLRTATINKSMPVGTDLATIVRAIIDKMEGVAISATEIAKLTGAGISQIPTIINGQAKDLLERTLNQSGYQWSIQNGEFKVDAKETPSPSNKIFVMSPSSGLLGSPTKTKKGIKFRSLLNAKVNPESHISMQSEEIKGIYKIINAVHMGDSRLGEWITDCEGVSL